MFLSPSELQHPNLVCLIGVTLDKPPIYLITEYMAKVSKHYVLEQKCGPHPISIFRGSSNIPYKSKVLNHSVLTNFILSQYFKYRCVKCEVFDLFMSCSSIRNYIIRQKNRQYMHTPNSCPINNHSRFNLATTGLFAGILEVSGKSRYFKIDHAGLCQRCLLRNGVH